MVLSALNGHKDTITSLDANKKLAKLVTRSIMEGGYLVYNNTMNVTVSPFTAYSFDGMVVTSDTPVTFTLVNTEICYLICFAKYQVGLDPILEMQKISSVDWETSVNKDYYITFAKFDLSSGLFTFVTDNDADYDNSDYKDKLGISNFKGPAADLASLPTSRNRDGDIRLTLDSKLLHQWDSATSQWKLVNVGALVASVIYDPPSLADGVGVTTTVSCSGAQVGDFVKVSFSLNLQGITLTGWVSALDTVSVRFQNGTGGVLDLASGILKVSVTKY